MTETEQLQVRVKNLETAVMVLANAVGNDTANIDSFTGVIRSQDEHVNVRESFVQKIKEIILP